MFGASMPSMCPGMHLTWLNIEKNYKISKNVQTWLSLQKYKTKERGGGGGVTLETTMEMAPPFTRKVQEIVQNKGIEVWWLRCLDFYGHFYLR